MSKLVHILNRARGEFELVTLGYFLPDKGVSSEVYEEDTLKQNAEIMGLKSKGLVDFVTPEEWEKEQAQREKERAQKAPTVSDALDEDNPANTELAQLVSNVERSLAQLKAALSPKKENISDSRSESPKSKDQPISKDTVFEDGLDLPMHAPPGIKADSRTNDFLRKSAKDKKKFLKECRDIGLLRNIALHESDMKVKKAARKAALTAERSAEMAVSASAASAASQQ